MRFIGFLLSFSMVLSAVVGYAQFEDTVQLQTDNGVLEGSLLTPIDKQKYPGVLIIAGSGPTDRDGNNTLYINNAYKMLADSLHRYGIASLRYDKRGIGGSENAMMPVSDIRLHHFVSDAVGWIEFLDSLPQVDKIIVIGHSLGSLLGMLAAQRTDVDGFISLAGAGRPLQDVMRNQFSDQLPKIKEIGLNILDSLEAGKLVDSVHMILQGVFRPEIQQYIISMFQYDPAEEIKDLEIPVLIIQGTNDIQVQDSNAERLYEAAQNAQMVMIDSMNHVLKPAPSGRIENMMTYGDPNLRLHEDLIPVIIEFIHDTVH